MYEVTDKGIDDGHRFITYKDKQTGQTMTYFEQEIQHVSDPALKEFLQKNIG